MYLRNQLILLSWVLFESLILSKGFFWAYNSMPLVYLFPVALCAWGSYLAVHYIITGEFVHEEVNMKHEMNFTGFIGLLSMVTSFPAGIVAVNYESFALMFFANNLFFLGYLIAHRAFTGRFL